MLVLVLVLMVVLMVLFKLPGECSRRRWCCRGCCWYCWSWGGVEVGGGNGDVSVCGDGVSGVDVYARAYADDVRAYVDGVGVGVCAFFVRGAGFDGVDTGAIVSCVDVVMLSASWA